MIQATIVASAEYANKSAVMATVLLAIGDGPLRRWCAQALTGAGHATVEVTRALELLDLDSR